MLKYTYHIEYYITDIPQEKYYGYYSCDDVLEKSIIITSKNVHSFYIDPLSVLASFIVEGKYLSNSKLQELYFLGENGTYSIQINILESYTNKYESNRYISNDLYLILDRTFRAIKLMTESEIERNEVDSIHNVIENKLAKIDLYSNYLLIETESPFLLHINRTKSLQYCKKVLTEIIRLLDEKSIAIYDSIDFGSLDDLHRKLYKSLQTSIRSMSHILNLMTSILGFSYEYTPYIELRDYFNKIMTYLCLELGEDITTKNEESSKKKDPIEKEYSKKEILEKLCPAYLHRNKVEQILNEINDSYHINECSKIEKASLVLLIRDHCNFLDQNIAKKFNQLRKLIMQYYGQTDISYKENDCLQKKEELYSRYPMFWNKMKNKGSYM